MSIKMHLRYYNFGSVCPPGEYVLDPREFNTVSYNLGSMELHSSLGGMKAGTTLAALQSWAWGKPGSPGNVTVAKWGRSAANEKGTRL